ncbi:hypothetical protein IEQ34_020598 [Dendrobium chrysotoxum]|uniref:Uncharacterized protein n=1 Tax=Dendrobium chrysotoxum TaxID=161865 RepID=A0AAV7G0W5_DENCH|nr:hypothetical protein IEQ34_020598 [Dendrobium chrysotoxum]
MLVQVTSIPLSLKKPLFSTVAPATAKFTPRRKPPQLPPRREGGRKVNYETTIGEAAGGAAEESLAVGKAAGKAVIAGGEEEVSGVGDGVTKAEYGSIATAGSSSDGKEKEEESNKGEGRIKGEGGGSHGLLKIGALGFREIHWA